MKCPMCEDGQLYRRGLFREILSIRCPYCRGSKKVGFFDWLLIEEDYELDYHPLYKWRFTKEIFNENL